MNRTNMKVNDEALRFVTGGDYGDSDTEWKTRTPMYKIGDTVEVYFGRLHWHTLQARIVGITTRKNDYSQDRFGYIVEYTSRFWNKETVLADEIERK